MMNEIIYLIQDYGQQCEDRDMNCYDTLGQIKSHMESLEKDAERYKLQKMFPALRVGEFHGKFRAECGSMILTDWLDSYDEAFDTAMQANKQ